LASSGAWTSLVRSDVLADSTYPIAGIHYPARLAQLRSWFSTDDACKDYLDWLRWPNGFRCPHCDNNHGPFGKNGVRRCSKCHRRVSVTAGTIFQDTRTPLTVWFEVIWLMSVSKNGISALTLSKILPVGSYQTAWTMLAKLRTAMTSTDKARLSGVVEVDEWYHGGVAKGGHSLTGKNLVIAAIEQSHNGRGYGRVRLGIIPDRSTWQLRKFIKATVEPGTLVITDGLKAYNQALAGYKHEPRNESAPNALDPHVLLPGVHRVFSLAERWLLGTHQGGVKREHLQEYLDEFAFRFNRRNTRERGMIFLRLLEHLVNAKPITYKELTKIGNPKASKPSPPGTRGHPGTLQIERIQRPWRH